MSPLSDSAILRHIARQPKKTASHKQLLRELGAKGEARRELTDRLYALVAKGELLQVDSERYAIPQATKGRNLLVGRLTMHRDGFGFVIPEVTSLDESLKGSLGRRHLYPSARHRILHARRSRLSRSLRHPHRWTSRRPNSTLPVARASDGCRHLPLRTPPQLRQADRRKSNPGNRNPARDGKPHRSAAVLGGCRERAPARRSRGVLSKICNGVRSQAGRTPAHLPRPSHRRRSQGPRRLARSGRHRRRRRNHRLAERDPAAARPSHRNSRRRKRFRRRRRNHDPQVPSASPLSARSDQRSASDRHPISPKKPCATAATTAISPSSPSMEKPRATSTTPCTFAIWKTEITNCKSTSPT